MKVCLQDDSVKRRLNKKEGLPRVPKENSSFSCALPLNEIAVCWVKSHLPIRFDPIKESKPKSRSRHRFERATPCLLIKVSRVKGSE